MLGGLKLHHFQPIQLLLLQENFIFFTLILGVQFLLPQRANNGKSEILPILKWNDAGTFNAWGIQTGPFAASTATFAPRKFHILYWEANSYYPRGPLMTKVEFSQL